MKSVLAHFQGKPSAAKAAAAALRALETDSRTDITSKCIPKKLACSGRIVAKSEFVLCGKLEAGAIFSKRSVKVEWNFSEGQKVKKGQAVCTVRGNTRNVLSAERTALNYLSLLSGIASKCSKASGKYGKWKIAATRKTLPGLSHSEKRAVAAGGCLTHRLDLSGGILVKDNHIAAIMKQRQVSAERAIEIAVGCFGHGQFVEVEVSSANAAIAAALSGASAILVDNVSPANLRRIAKAARKAHPGIILEASGGITLGNAGKYLKAGADFASTSELTMKIEPANLSLEFDH